MQMHAIHFCFHVILDWFEIIMKDARKFQTNFKCVAIRCAFCLVVSNDGLLLEFVALLPRGNGKKSHNTKWEVGIFIEIRFGSARYRVLLLFEV